MEQQDLNRGSTYQMIGKGLGIAFISPQMMLPAIIILIFCFPILYSSPLRGVLLFLCFYFLFFVLVQNNPSSYKERFLSAINYKTKEPDLQLDKNGIPNPIKKTHKKAVHKINGKKVKFQDIEDEFNLRTYAQIELDHNEIGCYVLQRGIKILIIFCWEVSGYDPSLNSKKAETILQSACMGLNQLNSDLDLKIICDINASAQDFLQIQSDILKEKNLDPLTTEIIKSRGRRGKQLVEQKRIHNSKILVFGKYRLSLGTDFAIKQNYLDNFISQTQPIMGAVQGIKFESKKGWENIFDSAYHYAYQTIQGLLISEKALGWQVRSLNVQELFTRDYLELHDPPIPFVPQYVIYNDLGLQLPIVNNTKHSLGVNFAPQKGESVIPHFKNSYLYLPNKKKYSSFIRISSINFFPPEKQSQYLGQLQYLWNVISKLNIGDCRIVSEITLSFSHILLNN